MAEHPAAILPASVLRNLQDKLYDKRKSAALEIENIVGQLAQSGDQDRVSSVLTLLIVEFALSSQPNHRKGGLIGLAAATVGLAGEAGQYLERIIPAVLNSFQDSDSRVRYYACEALYNIAKVTRGEFIAFFNEVFDALCKLSADSDLSVINAAHLLDRLVKDIVTESDQFSIEEFIPLLRERMQVLSPNVRQFLVGWITVLDSVPDIDMLGFLPDFLDGLFNMLGDSEMEIRVQADSALREFLKEIKHSPSVDYGRMAEILVQRAAEHSAEFIRLTALTWLNEFVREGGTHMLPYYPAISGAVLPSISDKEEKIRAVARETNEEQMARVGPQSLSSGFDINAMLNMVRRELSTAWESTRLESLRWVFVLLEKFRPEVLHFMDDPNIAFLHTLLQPLGHDSDEVVLLTLEVLSNVAQDAKHFTTLITSLTQRFNSDRSLLERRGSLIIRQLCVLLDAERVFREFATILEKESDLDFATLLVQALNLILLTAAELSDLRSLLKRSLKRDPLSPLGLFGALYDSWCHSPVATVSLCLLAQAYSHASHVIACLGEDDITVNLLVQLDKLVQLLETPIFAYLRLQLLEPGRYSSLLKTLYGILMLLPQQSGAFSILRTRLESVPTHTLTYISLPTNRWLNEPHSATSARVIANVPAQLVTMYPPGDSKRENLASKSHLESNLDPNLGAIPGENLLCSDVAGGEGRPGELGIDFEECFPSFERVQEVHRRHRKDYVKSQKRVLHRSSSSSIGHREDDGRLIHRGGQPSNQPSDEESYAMSLHESGLGMRRGKPLFVKTRVPL